MIPCSLNVGPCVPLYCSPPERVGSRVQGGRCPSFPLSVARRVISCSAISQLSLALSVQRLDLSLIAPDERMFCPIIDAIPRRQAAFVGPERESAGLSEKRVNDVIVIDGERLASAAAAIFQSQ